MGLWMGWSTDGWVDGLVGGWVDGLLDRCMSLWMVG